MGNALLILVTLEASLLGSGRLIQFGPLTLKMWLFVLCQLYVIWRLVFTASSVKFTSFLMVVSMSGLLCLSAVCGVIGEASFSSIGEDIKPLLYFTAIVFFDIVIVTYKDVELVVKLLKFAAVLMSFAYIVVMVCLALGIIRFETLYNLLSADSMNDFMFRGENGIFFYKGSLYIAVGLILFAFQRGRLAKVAMLAAILGLLATGTRGFFVALAAVIAIHILTANQTFWKKSQHFGELTVACVILFFLASASLTGKTESDYVRIETWHEVVNAMTPVSVIIGHGFGIGVPERPVHMEIAYMEIFHKQGALGLLWWIWVIALLSFRYAKARRQGHPYAEPIFLSAMFVLFESATNPFINNPIGIAVWVIAIVSLGVLSEESLGRSLPLDTRSVRRFPGGLA